MTTYAILSDIHGNQPALEAIRQDITDYPVDGVIALGDYITPFASPLENLNTLESMGAIIILGNNEERIVKLRAGELEAIRGKQQWYSLFYADRQTVNYNFSGLAYRRVIEAEGKRLALMHATPDSITEEAVLDEHIIEWRKNKEYGTKRINEILCNLEADFWISGHTHRAYTHCAFGKVALNPGSAGFSQNRFDIPVDEMKPSPDFGGVLLMDYLDSGKARFNPYTQYARLILDKNSYSVVFRALPYDYRRTVQDLINSGLARDSRAWTRLAVQEALTGCHVLLAFIETVMRLQEEAGYPDKTGYCFSDDIWLEAERIFPFQIPPLV